MVAGLAVTIYYVIRTHSFFGGSMEHAWYGINPISSGIFGVALGFAVIVIVSLMTPPPSPEVQKLVAYIRYPGMTPPFVEGD